MSRLPEEFVPQIGRLKLVEQGVTLMGCNTTGPLYSVTVEL